jgi:hypothetical protein
VNQFGVACCAQFACDGSSCGLVTDCQFDFDEFVIIQGAIDFSEYILTEAFPGNGDHGVQLVADSAKLFGVMTGFLAHTLSGL